MILGFVGRGSIFFKCLGLRERRKGLVGGELGFMFFKYIWVFFEIGVLSNWVLF